MVAVPAVQVCVSETLEEVEREPKVQPAQILETQMISFRSSALMEDLSSLRLRC